jgi:hypothetical protein
MFNILATSSPIFCHHPLFHYSPVFLSPNYGIILSLLWHSPVPYSTLPLANILVSCCPVFGIFYINICHRYVLNSAFFGVLLFVILCRYVKGTVAWDFLSKGISPKVPNRSSDSWSKVVSNIDLNSPRNPTSKVFPCYRPLLRILLSATGHCGGFGYALWATAVYLVIRYGLLRRICLCPMGHCREWSRTVKICIDFCVRYGP